MTMIFDKPDITVVIPTRNEVSHIVECVRSVLSSTALALEILVVDGESTDGTLAEVGRAFSDDPRIRIVSNSLRTTPHALNLGIESSSADYICILGAHAALEVCYLDKCYAILEELNHIDGVGGITRTMPGGSSSIACGIAAAMATPFGVGNSHFRTGAKHAREVDTIAFGVYRKSAFERYGLFDTDLPRNQDDEFNARVVTRGGRLLLTPNASSLYYARPTLHQLARQFYQYGRYKPLANVKVGKITTLRQLAPSALVTSAAITIALYVLNVVPLFIPATIISVYLGFLSLAAVAMREKPLDVRLATAVAISVMHVSYGLGYVVGLTKLTTKNSASAKDPSLSR